MVLTTAGEVAKSKHVIHSIASMHIYHDQRMFDRLDAKRNFGDMKLTNGQKMKFDGINIVRFKVHDGRVRTLQM